MAEKLGRMQLKRRRTWRALSSSAWELSVAKGPDRVTTEEIAAAAGVSTRTFFNYFLTKEDAILGPILAIGSDELVDLRQALLDRPADESPYQALFAVMTGEESTVAHRLSDHALRARLVKEHPSLLPRYLAAFVMLENTLSEALAERLGVDLAVDYFPHVIAASALAALRVIIYDWSGEPTSPDLTVLIGETFARLAKGTEF
jgi:AcrR family transcriptional regulator